MRRSLIGGLLAASVLFASTALATPPVFKDLSFESARAASVKSGRILVFDAMTSWCGPCKVMDKTTWVDESVVSWMNEHAVAIQLDMDHHAELRNTLRINAYPTVIAFKDGKEFDRIVGLKKAPEFLAWLKGVAQGESKLDQALRDLKEERAKGASGDQTIDYRRRLSLAEDLYEYGSYEEATNESDWLWENMPQDSEERSGALASLMGRLAKRHGPAKARFTEFRDAAAEPVNAGNATRVELTTWLTLNAVIDDPRASVDWALKMTETPDSVAALRSVGPTVFPLLVEDGHWGTAGKALANPVEEVDRRGSMLGAYDLPVAGRTEEKTKTIPAMPLMRKGDGAPAKAGTEEPKTVPAIPLMRKAQPAGAEAPKDAAPAKTMPAIPLVRKSEPGDKVAARPGEQPKTVPAIPIMRKPGTPAEASETGGLELPSMGAPATFSYDDPASMAREVRYRLTLEFRDMAATYYAACLAAGRDAEAARIAELTFKYSDSPISRLVLAERALRAGKPLPEHVKWMEEVEAAGKAAAQLRARLQERVK